MQQKEGTSSAFATAWMELETIMLSEASQVVRDKHHRSHLQEQDNEQNRTTVMEHMEQNDSGQGIGGGG